MSLPLRPPSIFAQDATPVQSVEAFCPICRVRVSVPVVREFVHVLRRLSAFAGVRLAADTPVHAHRCMRGHVVILTMDRLQEIA